MHQKCAWAIGFITQLFSFVVFLKNLMKLFFSKLSSWSGNLKMEETVFRVVVKSPRGNQYLESCAFRHVSRGIWARNPHGWRIWGQLVGEPTYRGLQGYSEPWLAISTPVTRARIITHIVARCTEPRIHGMNSGGRFHEFRDENIRQNSRIFERNLEYISPIFL